MIKLVQSQGAEVILIGAPEWNGILGSKRITPFYNEIANEMQIKYEDKVLQTIDENLSLKSDRFHSNKKGYKKIVNSVKKLVFLE